MTDQLVSGDDMPSLFGKDADGNEVDMVASVSTGATGDRTVVNSWLTSLFMQARSSRPRSRWLLLRSTVSSEPPSSRLGYEWDSRCMPRSTPRRSVMPPARTCSQVSAPLCMPPASCFDPMARWQPRATPLARSDDSRRARCCAALRSLEARPLVSQGMRPSSRRTGRRSD